MLGEILDDEGPILDRATPSEEMAKNLPIAAHGRRREIVPLQTEQEDRGPSRPSIGRRTTVSRSMSQ
jgi:hypothetical protein